MNDLNDSDIELIEAKIDGTLNADELVAFDSKMNNSKSFEKEYQLHKQIIQSLTLSNNDNLRKEFHQYIAESKQIHKSNRVKETNSFWLAAASVSVLILLALSYYFLIPQSTNYSSLYNAYFEVYPAPPVTRGNEIGSPVSGFSYYRIEEYDKAIESLERLPESGQNSLYLAMCYLKTDQDQLAIKTLESLKQNGKLRMTQTAEWYLALAQLKLGNTQSCKDLLSKIISNKQLYNGEAEQLINELE